MRCTVYHYITGVVLVHTSITWATQVMYGCMYVLHHQDGVYIPPHKWYQMWYQIWCSLGTCYGYMTEVIHLVHVPVYLT